MAGTQTPPTPLAQPGEHIDLEESVAGEEDPGASIDIADTPARPQGERKPGDQADDRPGAGKG